MSTTKTLKHRSILDTATLNWLGCLPYGLRHLPHSLMAPALWLALAASVQAQDPIRLQHRWELEPDTGALWNAELAEGQVSIDLGRLTSGVTEYRLNEARRIIQNTPRLVESDRLLARNTILQQLRAGENNPLLRAAQIAAWCQLFDASQAEEVWDLVRQEPANRLVVERILIEHQCPVATAAWLQRLQSPDSDPHLLSLAMEGVAACGISQARQPLTELVRSPALALPTKMIAARALGALCDDQLEDLASEVLSSKTGAKQLLAASLLDKHVSDTAEAIMLQIVNGNDAPAQVQAFAWFAKNRSQIARQLAPAFVEHQDNSLRLLAANVLHEFDDADSLRSQARLLSDRNPSLRRTIREHLVSKAQNQGLSDIVDEVLDAHLVGESFEGVEQAIMVATVLGQKHRCSQLADLLEHPRPEVHIRAAWALQQMADDPQVLDQILEHCQRWTSLLVTPQPGKSVENTDLIRLSFLFEALGRNAYKPADAMLRLYVPKNGQKTRPITRIPAIWALGHIWQSSSDSGLEQELAARILDMSITDPEEDPVKYTSAIALGLIGNPASIEPLKSAPYAPPYPIGLAIEWALGQIDASSGQISERR